MNILALPFCQWDREQAKSILADKPFPIFFDADPREGLFCMRRTKDRKMLLKIMVAVGKVGTAHAKG